MKRVSNLVYIFLLLLVAIIGLSVFVSIGFDVDGTDTNDQNNIGLPGDGDEGGTNNGTSGSNNSGNTSGNGNTGTSGEQLGFVEKKLLAANENFPKFVGKCNGCDLKTVILTNNLLYHTCKVQCEVCGTGDFISQEHNNLVRYEPVDENTHYVYYYCTVCKFERKLHLSHEIGENGICPCEVSCEHNNLNVPGTVIDKNTHKLSGRCIDCGKPVEKTEGHTMVDGVCSKCSFECEHKETTVSYEKSNKTHVTITTCKDCGVSLRSASNHDFLNTGVCKVCGFECDHGNNNPVVTNTSNAMHHYELSCNICGYEENYDSAHLFLEDGTCGMKIWGCDIQHTHNVVFVPNASNAISAYKHSGRDVCSSCGQTVKDRLFEGHSFGSDYV